MKKCFYQVFKPEKGISIGWGDCEICQTDSQNKNCKGYIEVAIKDFYVKGGG